VTARTNLTNLRDFLDEPLSLEAATVARGAKEGDPPEARVLSLADSAEEFFADIVKGRVKSKLEPPAWSVKKLDPIYKPEPEELEWQRTSELDPIIYATDKLRNLSALAPFDGADEKYKRRLIYWAVVLTASDGRKAFFFRSFTASAEIKRKKGAALVSRQGSFSRVEEAIFLFDDSIDCFAFGDFVYVIRKRDFRRIFDQISAVLRRAKRAARDLHAKVPIANFAEFESACGSDSRLADKVLAARDRSYFNQLSYAMLKPVIDDFKLGIQTTTVAREKQLVFRTEPDHRFRILKLIDDDYLRSSMTKRRYEVNSKTDPPSE
jgi:hypothetical protein